jgi:hypothetical protein
MKLRRVCFAIVILVLALSGCGRGSKEDSILAADKLASHPDDPTKPSGVRGVPDDKLQTAQAIEAAVKACVEAIKAEPNEPRYEFELGRVLLLGGMTEEAHEHLKAAADAGHAAASFYLGALQLETSRESFRKASIGKFKPAERAVRELSTVDIFTRANRAWIWWLSAAVGAIALGGFLFLKLRRGKGAVTTPATTIDPPPAPSET